MAGKSFMVLILHLTVAILYAKTINSFIEADLQAAFERLNPHLPVSCFEQVLQKLSKPESLD
jgi:hypothetical protein